MVEAKRELEPSDASRNGALGLECAVGRARVAIPVEAVDQIVEYEVTSPLPLGRAWIGGLGVHEGRVVVSVALADKKSAPGPGVRMAKGVLLDVPGSHVAWALEVASVVAFARMTILERRATPGSAALPPWITAAKVEGTDRTVGWIDVAAMVAELSKHEAGERSDGGSDG